MKKQSRLWAAVWGSVHDVPMLFVTLAVLIPLVILSMPSMKAYAWLRLWIVAVLVLVTVIDTVRGMIEDIKHGHVGLDVLAVVAILSTLAVGEFWASWTVVLMVYSGAAIEAYAQSSAERNLTVLLSAAPRVAHLVIGADKEGFGGTLRDIAADDVKIMDTVLIKPGETVPVDGVVLSKSATVDLSMINGEPLPQTILNAQRIPSGAVNGSQSFTLRATAAAADSQYQRILTLIKSAQDSRPRTVRTADLLAVPFTVIAFAIAGIAWFISGTPLRFAQVLVLATPCPLLIAAPVAYLGGTSRLAASGVLIKGQEILEQLTRVKRVFFDKTGTLTVKQPQVVRVERSASEDARHWDFVSDDMLVSAAGIVESYSIHILAQGIARAGKKARAKVSDEQRAQFDVDDVSHVVERSGLGITAEVAGHIMKVGRFAFVDDDEPGEGFTKPHAFSSAAMRRGVLPDSAKTQAEAAQASDFFGELESSSMAAYISLDGDVVARFILRDVPRENAAETVAQLKSMGIEHVAMLTGDTQDSAYRIASEVGISQEDVYSKLLPENKQRILHNIRKKTGDITMMAGDGVNDAPVLAAADIGVAITDGSSSAASETAHMVIMNDDISRIPRAIRIAHRTRRVMFESVLLGLGLAIIGMIVAAFGVIPAVVGAFGQEAIDVISILWALNAVRDTK
ncbi:heavy metal translocating P-type ATPase [Alloscardovia venturai]|uniref:Heavy metal translocating P-type ATPase n=1 Tax=Alloscardovia venturai TaxID=1769421 RepID=A0ABW2Y2J0_9BIFI